MSPKWPCPPERTGCSLISHPSTHIHKLACATSRSQSTYPVLGTVPGFREGQGLIRHVSAVLELYRLGPQQASHQVGFWRPSEYVTPGVREGNIPCAGDGICAFPFDEAHEQIDAWSRTFWMCFGNKNNKTSHFKNTSPWLRNSSFGVMGGIVDLPRLPTAATVGSPPAPRSVRRDLFSVCPVGQKTPSAAALGGSGYTGSSPETLGTGLVHVPWAFSC